MCSEIPVLELSTRIVVLMHVRERKLTTNTGTLALLSLTNGALHFRGGREIAPPVSELVPVGSSGALLYPSENAVPLTPSVASLIPRPLTLIIPDGSWRQARKVATREKSLEKLPRYTLPSGNPSEYRLRHSPHERNLCTFEAIARALGALEGVEIQRTLERILLMKVERTLWSRGTLPLEKCTTGIPEAAIFASHLAGARGTPRKSRSSEIALPDGNRPC